MDAAVNLISRSELARRAGVSRAAVTRACRPGYRLAPARVGRQLDASHEAVTAYLERTQPALLPTSAPDLAALADAVAAILARRIRCAT